MFVRRWLSVLVTGALLTALVIVGWPVAASAPGPDYLRVDSFAINIRNPSQVTLVVTTDDAIPMHPDGFIGANLVVGFAWADLDTGKVFIVTIHPVIGRDSHQRPDGWHAHTATVAGGATAPNDFCVASIDTTPTAGISIHGATMKVNLQAGALPFAPGAVDAAVGFTVQADTACASGLAVLIRT